MKKFVSITEVYKDLKVKEVLGEEVDFGSLIAQFENIQVSEEEFLNVLNEFTNIDILSGYTETGLTYCLGNELSIRVLNGKIHFEKTVASFEAKELMRLLREHMAKSDDVKDVNEGGQ